MLTYNYFKSFCTAKLFSKKAKSLFFIFKRDDRRRATHNEVERRRRDKINNWILKLSKIIPECKQDSSKGNFESQVFIYTIFFFNLACFLLLSFSAM